MRTNELKAIPREVSGKGPARRLRSEGSIPTVAYGDGLDQTLNLAVGHDDLYTILTTGRGRNSIIELKVDGGGSHNVMVTDYDIHPVSRRLLHADFQTVREDKPVHVEVRFETTGKPVGVQAGGTLLVHFRRLKLRCLPTAIPDRLTHDVSHLEILDSVQLKELSLPEGVEILMNPEQRIAEVKPPRVLETAEEEGEGEEGEEGAEGEGAEGEKAEGEGEAKPEGGGEG
jgi:large subunit ribosomal protein L25